MLFLVVVSGGTTTYLSYRFKGSWRAKAKTTYKLYTRKSMWAILLFNACGSLWGNCCFSRYYKNLVIWTPFLCDRMENLSKLIYARYVSFSYSWMLSIRFNKILSNMAPKLQHRNYLWAGDWLIEYVQEAVEKLSAMNHPDGDCPLCLSPLVPEEEQSKVLPFMKLMSCFHCFHR